MSPLTARWEAVAIFPRLGRRAPAVPVRLVSDTPASGRRPAELDDPDWLRARYERDGDMSIALELTARYKRPISRMMVRLARERLGIPSLPPGRRPQPRPTSARPDLRKPRIVKITARKTRDDREGTPASWESVLGRLVDSDQAKKARNVPGQITALEALAAAAWRLADQLDQAQAA